MNLVKECKLQDSTFESTTIGIRKRVIAPTVKWSQTSKMYIKETISKLLKEVAELKRRCSKLEAELELQKASSGSRTITSDVVRKGRKMQIHQRSTKLQQNLCNPSKRSDVSHLESCDESGSGSSESGNEYQSSSSEDEETMKCQAMLNQKRIKFAAKLSPFEIRNYDMAIFDDERGASISQKNMQKQSCAETNASGSSGSEERSSRDKKLTFENPGKHGRNRRFVKRIRRSNRICSLRRDPDDIGDTVTTKATDPKPNQCLTCGESFRTKAKLCYHQHVTHSKKNAAYKCPFCKKSLKNLEQLNNHCYYFHPNGPRLACGFCEKRFHFHSDLVIHESTHTGERPFRCDKCQMRFARMCQLKQHKKTHFKLLTCPKCHRGFQRAESLLLHRPRCFAAQKT